MGELGAKPPGLKDVARLAGVHLSTASLALRDDPRLPVETRERIRGVATKLGYRPNPLISALNAARRAGQVAVYQAGLAFVGYYRDRERVRKDPFQRSLFVGAKARAEELGYGLEHLWLREPDMTARRFEGILTQRRIHGLVLAPLDDPAENYELDWGRHVVVAIGQSLARPKLARVAHDNYRGMLRVLEGLTAAGATRIGLCLAEESDERTLGMWTGAYLAWGRTRPRQVAAPLIGRSFDAAVFGLWRERAKVDAVISVHPFLPGVEAAMRGAGEDPERVLVSLNLGLAESHTAGMYQEPERLGALAVERVVDLLHRGRGAEAARDDELLHLGRWVAGRARW